jgi:hypothetical protein
MVQALGEAWKLGWSATARCLVTGPGPKSRHDRLAVYREMTTELDARAAVRVGSR